MDDPKHRVYRPYARTYLVGGALGVLGVVLTVGGLWLGAAAPQVIETSGRRSMPVELWMVLCTVLLLVSLYVLATLVPGASRIEIDTREITVRMPLRLRRIPLASVRDYAIRMYYWVKMPMLWWWDGKKMRSIAVPPYRAGDGTLLRDALPALLAEKQAGGRRLRT